MEVIRSACVAPTTNIRVTGEAHFVFGGADGGEGVERERRAEPKLQQSRAREPDHYRRDDQDQERLPDRFVINRLNSGAIMQRELRTHSWINRPH